MGLCASLTSVRHSLFLFLSSCLWRAPCETWSGLLYFHGVHVLLDLFIVCSVFSEKKVFREAWWVSIGKMERSVGMIYSQYIALQPQSSSQKSSAFRTKEGTLPCTTEGFVSGGQIHSGQILRPRSSGYFVCHSNVLQQ